MSIDRYFDDEPFEPLRNYPKAAPDYDTLKKQYSAMVNLCGAMDSTVAHLRKTCYTEQQVEMLKRLLDGERDINQLLTNELEEFERMTKDQEREIKFLRYFYDAAGDVFGPADDDVYRAIAENYEQLYGTLPERYQPEEYE